MMIVLQLPYRGLLVDNMDRLDRAVYGRAPGGSFLAFRHGTVTLYDCVTPLVKLEDIRCMAGALTETIAHCRIHPNLHDPPLFPARPAAPLEQVPVRFTSAHLIRRLLQDRAAGPNDVGAVDDPQQLRDVLLDDKNRDPPVHDQALYRVEDPLGKTRRDSKRRLVQDDEARIGE